MIKAYINDNTITLIQDDKKISSFVAGESITTIDENTNLTNPYTFFKDYEKKRFSILVSDILDNICKLRALNFDSLIDTVDADRADKLYTNKEFKLSFENNSSKIMPVVHIESARQLLALELACAIKRGKPLKKCVCCDKYFFPSGRSDSVYCSRIDENGFSCKKNGAHKKYRNLSRSDDIKNTYDKLTKHNRYLKSKGAVSSSNYFNWLNTASAMYAQFQRGEISENTLSDWLYKDLNNLSSSKKKNEISDYLL